MMVLNDFVVAIVAIMNILKIDAYLGSVQILLIVCDDRRVSANRTMYSCILFMINLRLRACKCLRMAVVRCKRLILREISRFSESWLDRRARSAHRFLVLYDISSYCTPNVVGRRSPILVAIVYV